MKKLLSVVLSICMVLISVPVFATSSNEVVKVQLSDQAMAEAVGGYGTVQTQIIKNDGTGAVQALLVNGMTVDCTYTVTHNLNISGGGGIVISTGTITQNSTKIISGTAARQYYVRADITCGTSVIKASSVSYVN